MYPCVISVYSGSKNKADTTGICWHNLVIRIIKKAEPQLAQLGQQKRVAWRRLTLAKQHFCTRVACFPQGNRAVGTPGRWEHRSGRSQSCLPSPPLSHEAQTKRRQRGVCAGPVGRVQPLVSLFLLGHKGRGCSEISNSMTSLNGYENVCICNHLDPRIL